MPPSPADSDPPPVLDDEHGREEGCGREPPRDFSVDDDRHDHHHDPIRRFVSKQRELLRLELHEEHDEEEVRFQRAATGGGRGGGEDVDERIGGALRDLRVGDVSLGLCGRTVLELVPRRQRPRSAAAGDGGDAGMRRGEGGSMSTSSSHRVDDVVRLPAHRFTVGDEVEITGRCRSRDSGEAGGGDGGTGRRATMRGVVSTVTEVSVSIVPSSGPGERESRRRGDVAGSNSGGKGGGGGRGGGGGGRKKSKSKPSAAASSSSSFDDEDDTTLPFDAEGPLTVVRRSSGEVHRRLMRNLDVLEKSGVDHPLAGNIVRRMFYPKNSYCPPQQRPESNSATAAGTSGTTTELAGSDCAVDISDHGEGGRWDVSSSSPSPSPSPPPFNRSLDESQVEAVRFALSSDDVALIHGPPGTGKTTAVVELILQAVHRRRWKVLVCAPSNVAVDNVLERLVTLPTGGGGGDGGKRTSSAPPSTRVVRLGHPARVNPTVLRHSLEERVRTSDGSALVADARRELEGHVRLLASSGTAGGTASSYSGRKKGGGKSSSSSRGKKASYADRRLARSEIRILRKEIREREECVVRDIIAGVDVVFATNVGAASHVLDSVAPGGGGRRSGDRDVGGFDLIVIDEAAQALEASCWIPILRGRRLVLAGDHRQLPPTVRSSEASRRGLGVTMFDRAVAIGGDDGAAGGGKISRMLTVQYRMHRDISDWSSGAMYGGRLRPAASVASRTLGDLPHVVVTTADGAGNDDGRCGTLLLIDTAGCDMEEETTGSGSRFNRGEAQVVKVHVESLLAAGLRQSEIAIITPYNGQVDALRTLLLPHHPNLEVRSVDGFQGGEREAVVLSLVRSNRRGDVGFLGDERRINVAVTRARRHCAVVCDVDTVSKNDFLGGLVTWMGERGDHRSALEFVDDVGPSATATTTGEASDDVVARLTKEATRAATEVESRENTTRGVQPSPGKHTGGSTVACGGSESSNKGSSDEKESNLAHPLPSVRDVGPHGRKYPRNGSQLREEKRDALMDRIGSFAEGGVRGDELALGDPPLSDFERLVVREFAEELGLEHRSDGEEGNRRIVLSIMRGRKPSTKEGTDEPEIGRCQDTDKKIKDGAASRGTSMSVFSAHDASGSDDSSTSDREEARGRADKACGGDAVEMNGLLHDLALERIDRRKQQQPSQMTNGQGIKTKRKKKKKKAKSKGNRLGESSGQRAAKVIDVDDVSDGDDPDDDMAFLEAQIERVQTSHGRKIEGTGSGYRSVINGILISKPKPPEKKRDPIASSLIRGKLRRAEEDRKSKKGHRKGK